jgi:hypothetical protein
VSTVRGLLVAGIAGLLLSACGQPDGDATSGTPTSIPAPDALGPDQTEPVDPLATLAPVPAVCTEESYRAASQQIEAVGFPASDEWCEEGARLAFTVDVGAGMCPPDQRALCSNRQRAFFVAETGAWKLVTYGRLTDCEMLRGIAGFPPDACRLLAGS